MTADFPAHQFSDGTLLAIGCVMRLRAAGVVAQHRPLVFLLLENPTHAARLASWMRVDQSTITNALQAIKRDGLAKFEKGQWSLTREGRKHHLGIIEDMQGAALMVSRGEIQRALSEAEMV